jgi:hypothetical protein
MIKLTLGNAIDADAIDGKSLRGATVDEPLVRLPGIAEVVKVIAARPAWQRDQLLKIPDASYCFAWRERHGSLCDRPRISACSVG